MFEDEPVIEMNLTSPAPLKLETTKRGFPIAHFTDRYGVECHIQKSSCATEDCIWLGADKLGVKEFVAYRNPDPWRDMTELDEFNEKHHYVGNNVMHLTREMVAQLLPLLQRFVDTGELE